MQVSCDALVLNTADTKDSDKTLTLLCADRGRMRVTVKGGRTMNSALLPLCRPFLYANLELYEKNGMYWLRGGMPVKYFSHISESLDKLYCAAYFCEVATDISGEGTPAKDLLRLLLNSLYALDESLKDDRLVKAAFEWRAAYLEGYEPDLSGCGCCGKQRDEVMYLDVMAGTLCCPECMRKRGIGKENVLPDGTASIQSVLSGTVLEALRQIGSAGDRNFLSVPVRPEDLDDLGRVCETYLLNHLERGFDALDAWKDMRKLVNYPPLRL
ncbi:MAG: DNA repair protein RecO [Clostridia bacterium]|nr:DNA repair protein RecO [Clostridia bacterium]